MGTLGSSDALSNTSMDSSLPGQQPCGDLGWGEPSLHNRENQLSDKDRVALLRRIAELEAELQQCRAALQRSHTEVSAAQPKSSFKYAIAAFGNYRFFANFVWEPGEGCSGYEEVFGYSVEEFYQDQTLWMSRIPPEDHATVWKAYENIYVGHASTLEHRFYHRDGRLLWIVTHSFSQWDEVNQCWNVVAVLLDITAQKQIEIDRNRSEANLRALLDNLPFEVWAKDRQERLTLQNPIAQQRWQQRLGYVTQETNVSPELRKIWKLQDEQVWAGQVVHAEEEGWVNEEQRIFQKVLAPIWVGDRIEGKLGVSIDITDYKRLEQELRSSEEKLSSILNKAQAAIAKLRKVDAETWVCEYLSAGCEQVYGFLPEEMTADQHFWRSRVFPEDLPALPLISQVNQEITRTTEYRFYHRDGSLRWLSNHFTCYFNTALGQWTATVIDVDITQRKQAETNLRQKVEREQALNRVVQTIRNSLDLDTIFSTATTEMSQLLQVEQANIVQYLPERQCWKILVNTHLDPASSKLVGIELPDPVHPLADQLKRGEVVQLEHPERVNDPLIRQIAHHLPGSWLLIPLMVGNTIWGCLGQVNQQPGFWWTEAQVELAEAVAAQLAIAIQQANLFQQVQQLNQDLEQRVQERTTQLQLALAAAHMGIWELDCKTGRQYWSPELYEMLGFCTDAQERVLDQRGNEIAPCPNQNFYWSRVHPEDRAHIQALEESTLAQRSLCEQERRVLMPDGTVRWHLSRSSFIYDEGGQAIKQVGISMDVSDRKSAEEALRQSEELFRSIFQYGPSSIMLVRLDDLRLAKVNPAACDLLGYTEDELFQLTLNDITYPDDLEADLQLVQQLLEGQTTRCQMEKRMLRKNGEVVWIDLTLALISDSSGKYIYSLGMSEDITERKLTEQRLRASLAEKEVLLREIHHRVKNNLQIVSSLMRLQMRRFDDVQITSLIQETQNRVQSMALIHEKLYQSSNFAQIDFGGYVRSLVNTLFRSYGVSQSLIQLVLETHNISLDLNVAIPCGLIVNELVSNALKYAFPNHQSGTITIYLKPSTTHSNQMILTVSDDGIGISPDLKLETAESLGLQIVHSLVSQLRGTLMLDASQGTRFEMTLPLSES